jgi:hypothetical protein
VSFALRVFYQPPDNPTRTPPPDKPDHNQCKYIPKGLDQETDESFIERLDFLRDPFTFAKDQLDVFFKTLTERLKMPLPDEDEDEDADEVDGTVAEDTLAMVVDQGRDAEKPITIDD